MNLFVAGFIGSPTMNMVEATVEQDDGRLAVVIGDQRLRWPTRPCRSHPALKDYAGKRVVVGIRPEDMEDAALKPETPRTIASGAR